jgi:MSHA biogenesis protein MshQ
MASSGNSISFTGTNKSQLWGRLAMANANGSELMALTVPLFSEYFNGKSFMSNTADNCTSLSLNSQLSLSNPTTANGIAQAGNAARRLRRPVFHRRHWPMPR